MTAAEIVYKLNLAPHPEGGFYREVYRSSLVIEQAGLPRSFAGNRNVCTAIYYLLQKGDYSAFHRIKSDELWHFYAGSDLLLHTLNEESAYACYTLGNTLADGTTFQLVIPAGTWFAAEPAAGTDFTLAGCTVAPGFDFSDFEMASKEYLLQQFPTRNEVIERLCR